MGPGTCRAGVPNVVPVAFKDVTDDAKTLEGCQIQGAATAKGALIITPETVVVTTPGAENKKVL